MDFDTDSDEDTETELQDIKHLNAVLNADEPSTSDNVSQYTITSGITSTCTSKVSDKLSKIDEALSLNKITDEKLRRLEIILTNRLRECEKRLNDISNTGVIPERTESFRYFICGKPYFKDRSNFPPPDNEDTIVMKSSQMYDFSQVVSVSGWTVKDKSQFITEMHKLSQELKRNELQSRISELRRQKKVKNSNEIDDEIASISKEICSVKDKPLSEVALPIDKEYDWELLANRLNRRHTAQEYESLWKLFFHPKINKNSWSKAEHIKLQKIANENNSQDWDDIAKKLNTGRTGYQCFVYFRTNMTNVCIGKKWSKEEIEYLHRLVDYYREDHYIPWGKVAAAMDNRTKIQIYNKYLRLIENRKGRFLPEEDAVILNCINKFGINFRKMLSFMPGRSIIQIRNRYSVLTKMRVSTVWTIKEDRKLIQLMANQDSNVNFSSLCEFFPGKDRVHIRSRYITLSKWMRCNPNVDIKYAPRRAARRLVHGQPTDNLNQAVENLKNRMQTEVTSKRNRRINKYSSENDIDDAIITTILNEDVREEEAQDTDSLENDMFNNSINSCIDPNVTNLKKMLLLLNAKLHKEAFKNSLYNSKYPSLIDTQEASLIKVKSYSRKNCVQNYNMGKLPDIWGVSPLGPVQYFFPPHYATITGCRVLSSLTSLNSTLNNENINITVLLKRNVLLRHNFNVLLERFNILFLWPMLLSNEGPCLEARARTVNHKKKVDLDNKEPVIIPSIHIPRHHRETKRKLGEKGREAKRKKIETNSNQIDLLDVDEKPEITIKEDFTDEFGSYEY